MSKQRAATATMVLLAALAVAVAGRPAHAAVITTGHTGSAAPALAHAGGRLYVAWTGSSGTAAAKEVVVGWSTTNGQTITKISTVERTPQGEGPALVADPDNPAGVVLAWADGRGAGTLTATVYDGTAFGCRTAFTGLTTRHSPALAADSSGKLYLAWTDTTDHLNVARLSTAACPTTHTLGLSARTVLPQTAAYGPALVFDTTSAKLGMLIAWVAPDAAHTLTVASWVGSTTLVRLSTVNTAGAYPTSAPALSAAPSDLYLAFRAADNHKHLGFSEGCVPTCFAPVDTGTAVSSAIGADAQGATYAWFNPAGNLVVESRFAS
ncbi:hypothetical protein [Dactylosporangium sp. NPDC049140]|uniref:hypothetical protein n=1 Tax=Dactylosporangium sp. NPDC049140 TaxID=3155647 RepID=UPI0033E0D25A